MTTTQSNSAQGLAAHELSTHEFELRDGVKLFYRVWKAKQRATRAMILFHRGHEHSGRFEDVVASLTETHPEFANCHFFAWDARGHGESPGKRGVATSVAELAADADEFVAFLSQEYSLPYEDLIVLAHSIGAVVIGAWVHDYARPIRGMVLLTPALRVKLYVPLAIPGLRALHKVAPQAMVKSYVRPTMLTHDAEQARTYADDPLIAGSVSVNLLLDLHDTATRLIDDAAAITVPALVVAAGKDWVVRNKPIRTFYERLSADADRGEKSLELFEGKYHDLLHEDNRQELLNSIADFLRQRFAEKPTTPDLTTADEAGPSFARYSKFQQPLSPLNPRRWYFAIMRGVLGTIGRAASGIQLGWKRGFNSGDVLDYVYRNEAKGKFFVGKLADRIFLNAPGWQGIRVRRENMNRLLDYAVQDVVEREGRAHILDVAAGGGRYVLDALNRNASLPVTATLCDQSESALQTARETAAAAGVTSVDIVQSDAFDPEAICERKPSPNIGIVSGLFELFPSNQHIQLTLAGFAEAIAPRGWLIYTNQPWHPQQELIARSLHGFDRELWIMRCRSSAEMDQLVSQAGFEKVKMLIDDAGIFTVSLARKLGPDRNTDRQEAN